MSDGGDPVTCGDTRRDTSVTQRLVSPDLPPTHTRTVARRSASPGDAGGWIGGSRPPSPWPRRSGHPHPLPRVPAPQTPRDAWQRSHEAPGTATREPGDAWREGGPRRAGAAARDRGWPHLPRCTRAVERSWRRWGPHRATVTSILERPDQRVQRRVDGMRGASEDHPAMAHPHPACGREQCAPSHTPAFSPARRGAACAFCMPARARAWAVHP